jgi:hypothetical protein
MKLQSKIELIKTHTANSSNPTASDNANTDLLNYCLADSDWLSEMFDKFKDLLVSVDDFALACSADFVTEMIESHAASSSTSTATTSDMVNHQLVDASAKQEHIQSKSIDTHLASTGTLTQVNPDELIISPNDVDMESTITTVTANDIIIDSKPLHANDLLSSS